MTVLDALEYVCVLSTDGTPVYGAVWVGPLVVKELKRIVEQSEIVKCV